MVHDEDGLLPTCVGFRYRIRRRKRQLTVLHLIETSLVNSAHGTTVSLSFALSLLSSMSSNSGIEATLADAMGHAVANETISRRSHEDLPRKLCGADRDRFVLNRLGKKQVLKVWRLSISFLLRLPLCIDAIF